MSLQVFNTHVLRAGHMSETDAEEYSKRNRQKSLFSWNVHSSDYLNDLL